MPAAPAAAQQARDFLARAEASLAAIAAAGEEDARRACAAHVAAVFALDALAESVAGPRVLPAMSTAERAAFGEALVERLVADCVRERRPATLEPLGERPIAGGIAAAARLHQPDGGERILVWRLRQGGPWGWQAVDATLDGRSLALTLRAEVEVRFDVMEGRPGAAAEALRRGRTRP